MVSALLVEGKRALQEAGLSSASLESRLLLASALGVAREWLIMNPEAVVQSRDAARFRRWVRRRRTHTPIQYLIGEWGFWQDSFLVGPGVLVPRPETELLVETALEKLAPRRNERLKILELGVGSGALSLSLLREFPHALGFAMDRPRRALDWATRNARRLDMRDRLFLWQGELAGAVAPRPAFDLVVFNPPYLTSQEWRRARRELRYEPREAFDGGRDGMRFYLASVSDLKYLTRPEGWLLMEVSPLRAEKVSRLFARAGWQEVEVRHDLAGRKRVVCGRRAAVPWEAGRRVPERGPAEGGTACGRRAAAGDLRG